MDFKSKYSLKSPAVKRLMREAAELNEPTENYHAQPLEDNLFEWHFTIRGPPDTEFEGGIFHGRIILPPEYPMKPPGFIILTQNGRFETNRKICLSISSHHPELWLPSWSIRTALLALIGFFPTPGLGSIGSLECSPAERKRFAKKSVEFECTECGAVDQVLLKAESSSNDVQVEAKQLISQLLLKAEAEQQQETTVQSTCSRKLSETIGDVSVTSIQQLHPGHSPPSINGTVIHRVANPQRTEWLEDSAHRPGSSSVTQEACSQRSCSTVVCDIVVALLVLVIAILLLRRFVL